MTRCAKCGSQERTVRVTRGGVAMRCTKCQHETPATRARRDVTPDHAPRARMSPYIWIGIMLVFVATILVLFARIFFR